MREAECGWGSEHLVPVSVDSALVEELCPLAVFAGVMPPGMGLEGDPEVTDHVCPFLGPFLLHHRPDHVVIGLAELLP